jgi:Xaa-Pro dipeptidase
MMTPRLTRLAAAAGRAGLDALAVMPGPNLVYLTGLAFHLSERPVLLFVPADPARTPALVVPGFESGKVTQSGLAIQAFGYDDVEGPADATAAALASLGLAGIRLGVEARRIRFLELDLMSRSRQAVQAEAADTVFAGLRMTKDAGELDCMRRAVAFAEKGAAATLGMIRAGVTEREIAAELTLQTIRAGSDAELPFAPIVASGPNGANPHAVPTQRAVQPGDLITLDWGAACEGYFADITRTYALDGAPVADGLLTAYEAVRAANAAGRAAARPGATGQDVDRAARQVIEAAGLGAYFTHRTGHGLGLEGHEEPDMKEGSLVPLAPGMTFTVEPGAYIPGLGGVRIEDDVVVTETGSESLTGMARELAVLAG